MCRASLVPPEQPVLCRPIRPTSTTVLTITLCNIIESRPGAARLNAHASPNADPEVNFDVSLVYKMAAAISTVCPSPKRAHKP